MILHASRHAIIAAALFALGLAVAQPTRAQYQQQPQQQQQAPPAKTGPAPAAQNGQQAPAEAPKVDPEEEKAYKAFSDANTPQQADARIKMGEDFVAKYPKSKYSEVVYSRLMQDYFNKQQLSKMYDAADKALALNPDDVSVLVLEGWVIPHNIDPNSMDAERLLNKAETQERQVIEFLSQ